MVTYLKQYLIFILLISTGLKGQIDTVISDKKAWRNEVLKILSDSSAGSSVNARLQFAGYWLFEIKGKTLRTGPKIEIGDLTILNSPLAIKKETLDLKISLNDSAYKAALAEQLYFFQENGYPFAAFRLQDYQIVDGQFQASLKLESGPLVSFDSLAVLGYTEINRRLLEREINWSRGSQYRESYLKSLSNSLGRLEYLQMERSPAVGFIQEDARVYLYLKKRESNLINGVVGLNTDNEGNSTLTGDFQLRLLNVFNRGESFNIRWQAPGVQSQNFNLGFRYNYLFGSPIGLQSELEIFRQDSSFVRQELKLNLPYALGSGSALSLGIDWFQSSPLGSDQNPNLSLQNVQSLRYVLGWEHDRRNDIIVSSEGYYLNFLLGSGNRSAQNISEQQLILQGVWQYYLPVYKAWHWHQEIRSEAITGTDLQDNELFRLGGINSLRGFNEWSFFSPNYGLIRSELRYHLGPYDYLSALFDFAFAQNTDNPANQFDRHTGIGLGLNFQTKGGIFALILASGQTNNASYDLRAGKIHLSYVNRF